MGGSKRKPAKKRDEVEWSIIFPFKDVELQSGEKVAVRQWDIDTGAVLTGRVVALMTKIREAGLGENVDVEDMIRVATEECIEITRVTVGWSPEELRAKANWEDLITLFQAVIDTSLLREDGSGALPKIVELSAALNPLMGGRSASAKPSTSSSQPATPSRT